MVSIFSVIRRAAESLELHEILRFKHKMTEEQLDKLQRKLLQKDFWHDIPLLQSHDIKLIPEFELFIKAKKGDVSILNDSKYKDLLKIQIQYGDTPLHELADGGKTEILNSKFKDILRIQNNVGETPLHKLARLGITEILKPEYIDILKTQEKGGGSTPLHNLASRGKTEILKPEYKDILKIQSMGMGQGNTPLHTLAWKRKMEILRPEYKYFLEDALKIKNDRGKTPEDILKGFIDYELRRDAAIVLPDKQRLKEYMDEFRRIKKEFKNSAAGKDLAWRFESVQQGRGDSKYDMGDQKGSFKVLNEKLVKALNEFSSKLQFGTRPGHFTGMAGGSYYLAGKTIILRFSESHPWLALYLFDKIDAPMIIGDVENTIGHELIHDYQEDKRFEKNPILKDLIKDISEVQQEAPWYSMSDIQKIIDQVGAPKLIKNVTRLWSVFDQGKVPPRKDLDHLKSIMKDVSEEEYPDKLKKLVMQLYSYLKRPSTSKHIYLSSPHEIMAHAYSFIQEALHNRVKPEAIKKALTQSSDTMQDFLKNLSKLLGQRTRLLAYIEEFERNKDKFNSNDAKNVIRKFRVYAIQYLEHALQKQASRVIAGFKSF